jgi:hypothetical protein
LSCVIVVTEQDAAAASRVLTGWASRRSANSASRWAFKEPARLTGTNTYVVEGSLALRNHLAVRDTLRADPALREQYAAVKRQAGATAATIDEYGIALIMTMRRAKMSRFTKAHPDRARLRTGGVYGPSSAGHVMNWRCAVVSALSVLVLTAPAASGTAMRDAASASRPHDAVSRATAILLASMPGVTIVAFSPDSRLLAGAYTDGTIQLSNPATSQPRGPVLRPGHGPAARVIGMAFSPDGTRLAGAYTDGTVRLWSVATGQLQGPPRQVGPGGQRGLDSVAFSPDGTRLAGAYTDGTVRLWNPATGQLHGPVLRPASATSATAVAFSPDGTRLAGAYTDGTIRLWNPATGQPQGSSLRIGSGRQGGVQAVAFSADGKLLAGVYDGTIQIWSRAAAKPGVLDSVNWLTMLAFAVAIAVSAAAVIKTAFETRRLKFSPPSPGSQLWIYLY